MNKNIGRKNATLKIFTIKEEKSSFIWIGLKNPAITRQPLRALTRLRNEPKDG